MYRHSIFIVALLVGFPQVCSALDIVTRDDWKAKDPIRERVETDAARWRQKQIKYLLNKKEIKSEREVQDNIEVKMPLRTGTVYLTLHATDEYFVGGSVIEKLQTYQKKMQEGYSINRQKYHLLALPGYLPYNYIVLKDGSVAEGRELKYGPFSNTTYKTDITKHITVVLEGKFGANDNPLNGKQRENLLKILAKLAKEHKINVDLNFSFHQKVAKQYTTCQS